MEGRIGLFGEGDDDLPGSLVGDLAQGGDSRLGDGYVRIRRQLGEQLDCSRIPPVAQGGNDLDASSAVRGGKGRAQDLIGFAGRISSQGQACDAGGFIICQQAAQRRQCGLSSQ